MPHSTITSKGQTTLPVEIRKALHLKAGDRILYEIQGDTVTIRSHPGAMSLFGILKPSADKKGVPIREARAKAAKAWVEEAAKKAKK